MRYPEHEERVMVTGLGAAPRRRTATRGHGKGKRVCASDLDEFAWLQLEPCMTYYDQGNSPAFRSSKDVADFLAKSTNFAAYGQELFMVIVMDAKNQPLGVAIVNRGGRADAVVDTSLTLRPAILLGGYGFIIAHNHPSNQAEPSHEDVVMTERIQRAGEAVSTPLVDHIIVTHGGSYFSFLDAGLLKPLSSR